MNDELASSVARLLAEADEVESGNRTMAEFLNNLNWAIDRVARDPTIERARIVDLLHRAVDVANDDDLELSARHARALAEVVMLAVRHGDRADSVRRAQSMVESVGLVAGSRVTRLPSSFTGEVDQQSNEAPDRLPAPTERARTPVATSRGTTDAHRTQSMMGSMRVLGMGWAIVLSLVGGILGGVWIDGQFSSSPIATLVGLVFGLFMAWQVARQMIEETRRR